MFAGRTGFVRLALRTGAPVVPVVGYGAHHAVVVLSRGERLARMLGLNRLRIKAFPILLTPFGLTSIVMPPPPLPSSITVEFMDAIDWSRYGPDAADDERIVRACYEEVTSAMQRTLDRLHDEHPHPVLEGCSISCATMRSRWTCPRTDCPTRSAAPGPRGDPSATIPAPPSWRRSLA